MRLIDKDALMERTPTYIGCGGDAYIALWRIEDEPEIEAEPVRHERWIESRDNDGMDYECSNPRCQCRISYNGSRVSGDFNYCPNCGARMDGESE